MIDFLKAAFGGFFSALFARLFGKPIDPETIRAEHENQATRKEAELLAKPTPDWRHTVDDL